MQNRAHEMQANTTEKQHNSDNEKLDTTCIQPYIPYIRRVSNVRLRSETTPTSRPTQTSNRAINWQVRVRVTGKGDTSPNPKFE